LLAKQEDYGCNGLEKILKLYTTKTTTNIHVFDENEKLRKFAGPKEIIDHFIDVRYSIYVKRKKAQLKQLEKDALKLSNRAKYILETLSSKIDLRGKKNNQVSELLKSREYSIIDDDDKYSYLVKMPMDSVTEENVEKILKERDNKNAEVNILKGTSENQLWLNELDTFMKNYKAYLKNRTSLDNECKSSKKTKKSAKRKKKVKLVK